MKRRRILTSLLALGMLLPTAAWAKGEEMPRNEGPFLEQIQIDAETAARGGTLSIAADAWDDDGIWSFWVYFIHDESGTLLSVPMELRFGDPRLDGRYSAKLEIPENAPLGKYQLRSVVLMDPLDNRTRYFRQADMRDREDIQSLDELLEGELFFTVEEDKAGPQLLSCSVIADSVQAGKDEEDRNYTFQITMEALDSGAGFEKASLIFESEKGKKFYTSLNRKDWQRGDIYQKDVSVRENQTEGEYRLVKATLEDRAGNKTILGYGKDALPLDSVFVCGVRVKSQEDGKGLAPALKSVTIGDRRREHIDQTVDRTDYEIIVKAEDRGSRLHHITVKFKNDETGKSVSKVIRAEGQEHTLGYDVYIGWLTLGSWEQPGTFTLDTVVVTDEAGNSQSYRRPGDCSGRQLPLPCSASFTAKDGPSQKDIEAPVVSDLEMERVTKEGLAIPLRVKVSDDLSGVDTVSARFENREGRVITLRLYPKEDGWYSGTIRGSRIKKWGQYHLVRLTVSDNAGNRRVYQQQAGIRGEALPRQITFTVQD